MDIAWRVDGLLLGETVSQDVTAFSLTALRLRALGLRALGLRALGLRALPAQVQKNRRTVNAAIDAFAGWCQAAF
jgi:hypothetical protein